MYTYMYGDIQHQIKSTVIMCDIMLQSQTQVTAWVQVHVPFSTFTNRLPVVLSPLRVHLEVPGSTSNRMKCL